MCHCVFECVVRGDILYCTHYLSICQTRIPLKHIGRRWTKFTYPVSPSLVRLIHKLFKCRQLGLAFLPLQINKIFAVLILAILFEGFVILSLFSRWRDLVEITINITNRLCAISLEITAFIDLLPFSSATILKFSAQLAFPCSLCT